MALAPANILTYNAALNSGGNAKAAAQYIANNYVQTGSGTASQTRNAPVAGGGSSGGSNAYANANPVLQQAPSMPSFDSKPYDDLIASITNTGNVLTGAEASAETAINQNKDQQLTSLTGQRDIAQQQQNQAETSARTDAKTATDQQRQAFSELAQGFLNRYGSANGLGAFTTELAGRSATSNIAQIQNTLSGNISKINTARAQLQNDYQDNWTKINNQSSQLIQQAKDNLAQDLASLDSQKAQVGIAKSQQQSALLSHYQDTVNAINANNTNYLQQLQQQALAVQNKLDSANYSVQNDAQQQLANLLSTADQIKSLGYTPTVDINGKGGGSLSFSPTTQNNPNLQPKYDTNGNFLGYFNPGTGKYTPTQSGNQPASQGNNVLDSIGSFLSNTF